MAGTVINPPCTRPAGAGVRVQALQVRSAQGPAASESSSWCHELARDRWGSEGNGHWLSNMVGSPGPAARLPGSGSHSGPTQMATGYFQIW